MARLVLLNPDGISFEEVDVDKIDNRLFVRNFSDEKIYFRDQTIEILQDRSKSMEECIALIVQEDGFDLSRDQLKTLLKSDNTNFNRLYNRKEHDQYPSYILENYLVNFCFSKISLNENDFKREFILSYKLVKHLLSRELSNKEASRIIQLFEKYIRLNPCFSEFNFGE